MTHECVLELLKLSSNVNDCQTLAGGLAKSSYLPFKAGRRGCCPAPPRRVIHTHFNPRLLHQMASYDTAYPTSARPIARHVIDTHCEPSCRELYGIL